MEEGLLQRKQEEEMVGETLQGMWARNNNTTYEITIDTSGSSMPSKPASGTGYLIVEGEDKGLPESTAIYYDTATGIERNTGVVKLDATASSSRTNRQDGQILKNKSFHDSNVPSPENSNPEETILDLEKLFPQKTATHDFICPHCNDCIKTVILRPKEKKRRETTPTPSEFTLSKITCTSCLKVFCIPFDLLRDCFTQTPRPAEPGENPQDGQGTSKKWDILKCIVYGGLIESITSLSIVISAASADAATLNIIALGLANLIGGLLIIGHNLWELKNDHSELASKREEHDHSGEASNQTNGQVQVDRYKELLGQGNFLLHATVAVLSFLVFGLVPLVTYGFSFFKSDNRDLKLAAVVAASVLCIAILAIGKAYIQKASTFFSYIKTVLYYVSTALVASGVSYIVGELIKKALEKLGWFESSVFVTLPIPDITMVKPAWGSY